MPQKLERAVTLLDKHDWHVMVRTSDEADVHAALDAFEHAAAVNPVPASGRRPPRGLDAMSARISPGCPASP